LGYAFISITYCSGRRLFFFVLLSTTTPGKRAITNDHPYSS
jgi:hypothetical protein